MGEVYRARDTKLDRDVALKILPESFAQDPDRLTRFEREAKTLAALNHAHIAQIYGLEQSAGGSALVMELVEGDDLAARIARAPVPIDEALPIARQIAEALEAAHESGIVHRDLKPANVKVRADGMVKVLDFGLAKLGAAGPTAATGTVDAASAVTSPAMTMHGAILGTAAYMSPEQAKGRPVDRRGAWNADGVIVLSHGRTLARVPAGGGTLEPLTTLDAAAGETLHSYPHFLPDGQHLLYTAYKALTPVAVYAIRVDRPSERQKVMDGGSNVQYADGALLYVRGTSLVAQPFDASRRSLSGEPVAIVDRLLVNIAIHFGGAFSASQTGAVVHQGTGDSPDMSTVATTLVWRAPSGQAQTLIGEPATYRHLAIAPDGRHALVTQLDPRGRSDLWTIDLGRGVRTRVPLTLDASPLSGAVWSADATSVVVNLTKGQGLDLYRKPNDSASGEQLLLADERPKIPMSVSRDGRFLLYDTVNADSGGDIWALPLDAPAKAAPFVSTSYFERFAQFSPDGKWVAYASDDSGANEIYVRAFPGGQTQVRVSASGGDVPRWSRDGRQLFFYSSGKMMAANLKASATTLEVTSVTPLFDCRPPEGFRRLFYDVMPDGRFLMMMPTGDAPPMSLTLTVNWPQLRPASR